MNPERRKILQNELEKRTDQSIFKSVSEISFIGWSKHMKI